MFFRPHPDNDDIAYDKFCNYSIHEQLGFIQYNACFVLTCAIWGTSNEKNNVINACFEHRAWFRRNCLSYKMLKKENVRKQLTFILHIHRLNFFSTLQSCVVSNTHFFLQLLTGGVNLIKNWQIQKIKKFIENLLEGSKYHLPVVIAIAKTQKVKNWLLDLA